MYKLFILNFPENSFINFLRQILKKKESDVCFGYINSNREIEILREIHEKSAERQAGNVQKKHKESNGDPGRERTGHH